MKINKFKEEDEKDHTCSFMFSSSMSLQVDKENNEWKGTVIDGKLTIQKWHNQNVGDSERGGV